MIKRLLDDVSVNELLEFRNEGYTNSQIAEMLDACDRTIYRIIGKMPDEMIAKARSEGRKNGSYAGHRVRPMNRGRRYRGND